LAINETINKIRWSFIVRRDTTPFLGNG
jgi:hypothetical protein